MSHRNNVEGENDLERKADSLAIKEHNCQFMNSFLYLKNSCYINFLQVAFNSSTEAPKLF